MFYFCELIRESEQVIQLRASMPPALSKQSVTFTNDSFATETSSLKTCFSIRTATCALSTSASQSSFLLVQKHG
jgi:hypothetical protein